VILIKGIGAASRSVCVFFLLWLIIIYVFAVVFRQLADGSEVGDGYFGSVPEAMNTLLLRGILADKADLVNDVATDNAFFWCIMIFFIGLAGITVMYMLVGVLVDVVSVIAATEKEAMTVQLVANGLREKLEHLGRDTEAPITKYEFKHLISMPEIAAIIQDIGVDVVVLIDMADVLYDDPNIDPMGLSFQAFVEIILNMRGNNEATVKDVKELVRVMKNLIKSSTTESLKSIRAEFAVIRNEIWELKAATRDADEDGDDDDHEDSMMPKASSNLSRQASRPGLTTNFSDLLGKVKT